MVRAVIKIYNYTYHKIMQGLLDASQKAGNHFQTNAVALLNAESTLCAQAMIEL